MSRFAVQNKSGYRKISDLFCSLEFGGAVELELQPSLRLHNSQILCYYDAPIVLSRVFEILPILGA